MIVGRIAGWLLIAGALLAAGREIVRSLEAGHWLPITAGELWAGIDFASLNLVQAVIQRYLHPAIWEPGVVTLLLWPAWIVLLVPGVLLVVLFRRRDTGRRWRFRRRD